MNRKLKLWRKFLLVVLILFVSASKEVLAETAAEDSYSVKFINNGKEIMLTRFMSDVRFLQEKKKETPEQLTEEETKILEEAEIPETLTLPLELIVEGKKYPVTRIDSYFRVPEGVKEIIVPEGIKEIGAAFCYNSQSLKKVAFPSTLKSSFVFPLAGSVVEELTISKKNPYYMLKDKSVYDKSGKRLFWTFADDKNYTVAKGVVRIKRECFKNNTKIRKIIIPEGVESIESNAFSLSQVNKIVLPESAVNLSRRVFSGTTYLTRISLPKTISTIPGEAFFNSGIKEIVIPEGVTKIRDHAFGQCRALEKITLPSTLRNIHYSAFNVAETYFFDETDSAEKTSSLKADGIKISGKNPYYKVVNGAILSKSGKTFYQLFASGETYQVPAGVTRIKKGAFKNTLLLRELIIPKSITDIDENIINTDEFYKEAPKIIRK